MAPTTELMQSNRMQSFQPQASSQSDGRSSAINVGQTERWVSLAGGGLLTLLGLSRGSLGGLGLAVLGAGLLKRGATGQCEVYSALGINRAAGDGAAHRIPAGHGVKMEQSVTIAATPDV